MAENRVDRFATKENEIEVERSQCATCIHNRPGNRQCAIYGLKPWDYLAGDAKCPNRVKAKTE